MIGGSSSLENISIRDFRDFSLRFTQECNKISSLMKEISGMPVDDTMRFARWGEIESILDNYFIDKNEHGVPKCGHVRISIKNFLEEL